MQKLKEQKNIPSNWQQLKLGDCLTIKHGRPQKEIEVEGGKYPILATGGIIGRTNTALYSKPSVLIGRKGTIDKPRYMDTPFWTVDTLFYSHIKDNSVAKYLFYKFNTIEWYDYNEASGVPSLSATTVSSIKINLPPLPEQNRIVSVLETWDKVIENLNKKIEIKKQIKKGLMQDLLTGKKRLSGFKDKWETVTLGDVSNFINGFTFKSSTYINDGIYKVITIANVQDGFMFIDEPKLIKELPVNISKEQILNKGDILISMTGNVGRVCIVNTDNCLLNQRVGKIVPKNINKDLLYLFLYDRKFLNKMIGGAQGGAQGNLSTGDIKEYNFNVPKSKEEQNAIAEILTTADEEIVGLEKKLKIIKEQKKFLLNNLITGTIRTPETLSTKVTK